MTFQAFQFQIGRQGFAQARAIYAAMQKKKPDFKLDEILL